MTDRLCTPNPSTPSPSTQEGWYYTTKRPRPPLQLATPKARANFGPNPSITFGVIDNHILCCTPTFCLTCSNRPAVRARPLLQVAALNIFANFESNRSRRDFSVQQIDLLYSITHSCHRIHSFFTLVTSSSHAHFYGWPPECACRRVHNNKWGKGGISTTKKNYT